MNINKIDICLTFFTLGLLFIFAFYFYSIFWFPSSHLNDKNPVRFINFIAYLSVFTAIITLIYVRVGFWLLDCFCKDYEDTKIENSKEGKY